MEFGDSPKDLGSMDSPYEQNTDSMSTMAGNNSAPAEDPPAADAPEDDVNNKIFHKYTTSTAYAIKQTDDGGIKVLRDLLEHLLHTGYTESLQPELCETLRQHQPHETFPISLL